MRSASFLFLVCVIGASLCLNSYTQPMWPSPGVPQQIGPYIILVNNQPAGETEIEEESLEQRMASELERLRGSSFPSLQQYHHNENVNQYYGFASSNMQNLPNNYMVSKDYLLLIQFVVIFQNLHSLFSYKQFQNPADSVYGDQINSRQKNRFRPSLGNSINRNQVISPNQRAPYTQDQQQRLLFRGYPGFFFPSVLYTLLSDFSTQLWSTTTTFFQYNSTLTTTVVTSCIPLNQFASVNSMFSTNSCRRKRDEGYLASILIGEDVGSSNPVEKNL